MKALLVAQSALSWMSLLEACHVQLLFTCDSPVNTHPRLTVVSAPASGCILYHTCAVVQLQCMIMVCPWHFTC